MTDPSVGRAQVSCAVVWEPDANAVKDSARTIQHTGAAATKRERRKTVPTTESACEENENIVEFTVEGWAVLRHRRRAGIASVSNRAKRLLWPSSGLCRYLKHLTVS